eukprot:5703507-Pyramimonas_sp.AAC.1
MGVREQAAMHIQGGNSTMVGNSGILSDITSPIIGDSQSGRDAAGIGTCRHAHPRPRGQTRGQGPG